MTAEKPVAFREERDYYEIGGYIVGVVVSTDAEAGHATTRGTSVVIS